MAGPPATDSRRERLRSVLFGPKLANGCESAPVRPALTQTHMDPAMRIGLIGPPFIEIPPRGYGGTELFIANLARDLHAKGHDVTVYGNGDSRLPCRVKWRYPHAEWPLDDDVRPQLKNADHTAWAIYDAAASVDVLHLNDIVGVPFTTLSTCRQCSRSTIHTSQPCPSSTRSILVFITCRSLSGWPVASRCLSSTWCTTAFH